jgi:hypothetical protein
LQAFALHRRARLKSTDLQLGSDAAGTIPAAMKIKTFFDTSRLAAFAGT